MNSTQATIAGAATAVVAAAVVGLVTLTGAPEKDAPPWRPKKGFLYPRCIQGRSRSNEDFTKFMEAHAKTNITGTTRWVKAN